MRKFIAAGVIAFVPAAAFASPWVDEGVRDEPAASSTMASGHESERGSRRGGDRATPHGEETGVPGVRSRMTTSREAPVVDLTEESQGERRDRGRAMNEAKEEPRGRIGHRPSTIHQRTAEVAHWVAHSSHRHVLVVEEETFTHEHEIEVIDLGHPVPVKTNHHTAVTFDGGPNVSSGLPLEDRRSYRGGREIPMKVKNHR